MHTHAEHRPFWQPMAFAAIWYAAIVLFNLQVDPLRALLLGVVPWLGTSVVLWRVAHGGVKAWRLILLGLPTFYFLWALTVVFAYRFVTPITG
ncbi:hypothetical protein [Lentzea flava]|uniref:Uncharacterized protein n=1 Tax=Lentzea flava TaxID=103732 RepID=A0ABQ2UY83_9PSEU|nr:hypothetical protein [Lentzea flava]MCP2202616.1 hypothetical protein [Lentzea flava]GGU59961.1 hypothetical protein GCM10010178_60170 [Lentzea flava]